MLPLTATFPQTLLRFEPELHCRSGLESGAAVYPILVAPSQDPPLFLYHCPDWSLLYALPSLPA